jgi:hypothetical protein
MLTRENSHNVDQLALKILLKEIKLTIYSTLTVHRISI